MGFIILSLKIIISIALIGMMMLLLFDMILDFFYKKK